MLISIIVPIYNIAPYIRACLDSCVEQTYRDIEVICVDDGSTDESGYIADEYAAQDKRFRVIHKANGGLPSARKAGIEAAKGEYVFHLDGDDNIPLDAIERLVAPVKNVSSDIVIGDYSRIDLDGMENYFDSRVNAPLTGQSYLHFILTEGLFNIWGKLIRRSLYVDNQVQIPLSISMAEDLVAMTQLAYYAKNVAVCKSSIYNYYVRSSSMSVTHKGVVGELTDRTIYAVLFVVRFLVARCDDPTLELLSQYVKGFVYEYMHSPHSVAMRKDELHELCRFLYDRGIKIQSFRDLICRIAASNLQLAKSLCSLHNAIRNFVS